MKLSLPPTNKTLVDELKSTSKRIDVLKTSTTSDYEGVTDNNIYDVLSDYKACSTQMK